MFPWDSMLFEAGFFAMFLPALHTSPMLAAVAAPRSPRSRGYTGCCFLGSSSASASSSSWGSTSQDTGYLKGFLVNQPLPSPLGWIAQKLPLPALKGALVLMFLVEIPVPFSVFLPGRASVVGALSIDGFMLVIWPSGTFGYFSLIMMVVSLSWLDRADRACLLVLRLLFAARRPVLQGGHLRPLHRRAHLVPLQQLLLDDLAHLAGAGCASVRASPRR